ncbi:hypothetical protein PLICRDRAFT_178976 [Plicaturopsis crispa FD-325 SS-3]|uniref:Metal homeostatis protein bsd2 n=1 Tax=Plicaturopsis crispa FD-325 SS-3 TaxID=944288 RepID=A0A0C9T7F6_PLICR|nr:hypothetical protein PLICRDRAFT_178976 [Plicaturopsis crispa FD-325 SS-3]
MSARYAPLPNPRSLPTADSSELDDAFEGSDNEDDTESTPLTSNHHPSQQRQHSPAQSIPGAYDFEREYDYDYPPPGSPPRPSAVALPNDYGNSNGMLPDEPVRAPAPRLSFFRRTVGAILPTHYMRVPTGPRRARGGGMENDGVFANVMAKPGRTRAVRNDNGDVHLVPEDNSNEAPPSYNEAQADSVPPYWETTVHAPSGLDPDADMMIDDLPSGSFFVFAANLFTSFFFQFVGFLLTYLLHTSHAAKYGSRAGLGLTLIQFGYFNSRTTGGGDVPLDGEDGGFVWPPAASTDASSSALMSTSPPADPQDMTLGAASREWLSFLLMTLGWFLLLSSSVGFWRIKRWEKSIRASSAPAPLTREDIERDIAVRRNIEAVFGFGGPTEEEEEEMQRHVSTGTTPEDEARLTNDLRAAGLL